MILDAKKKISATLLILTLMVLTVGFFLIYPLFQEIKQGSQELLSEKEKLAGLRAEVENLKKFQGLYKTIQPELEGIEKAFIDLELPIGFIKFLEKIADDSGITIKIYPQNIQKGNADFWSAMNFQITAYGSLVDIFEFLEKLENSPYLIEIFSLDAKRLAERDVVSEEMKGLSEGDARVVILIKVFGR